MSDTVSPGGLTEKLVTGTRRSDQPTSRRSSGDHARRSERRDIFETRYGYNWDLCMIFPTEAPEGMPKASDVVKRLHSAGLETYCYNSVQRDEIIVKIRAPLERIARYAGDVEYTMRLDEARVKRAVEDGSKEPPIAGRHITHDPTITVYRPHEYIYGKYGATQRLAHMYACAPYLEHPFASVHRIKLMRRIIEATAADGCGLNLSVLMRNGALKAFFPFHDEERRESLFRSWVKRGASPNSQPLDEVKDYMGEKIAMYFALLGHYTTWLAPLSLLGVVMCIDQLIEWDLDATLVPYFSVFVSLWAVLMLEFWKRKESRLAMRWGMSDFEDVEHDRPDFKGDTMVSFVDGSPMTYYPNEEYIQLMVLANILVVAMLVLAVALLTGIFILEVDWDDSSNSFLADYGSYLASFLLSLEIQIMNFVYKKVAIWTTDRENHRTDTIFEDVLIAKLAVFQLDNSSDHMLDNLNEQQTSTQSKQLTEFRIFFNNLLQSQFVNSYASLFYIAFVQPYTTGCTYSSCLDSLCQSLAIIFCTRVIIANTVEVYLPRYLMHRKAKQERVGVPDDAPFSKAEIQYAFDTYDEMMGPLGDMSEISIQFGYVTLFVVSFPVAPLLAFLSNYVEIRIDAVKIMYEYRRPFPRGAQDIGTWQMVWTATAAIAVITNAGLVFFTADELDWSEANLLWGFLIWQYAIFFCMALFSIFVPDVPYDVRIQLDRQKFVTSKVIDQIPDESTIPPVRSAGSPRLEMHDSDDQPPPGKVRMPRVQCC